MTEHERQERMEKLFEKMLNMERTNREMYEQCRNVAHEPMTNEEWLKSLDTEGLVDYLYEVHKGGNSVERQRWIERHKEQVKMQFRGWLKEKHNDNMGRNP